MDQRLYHYQYRRPRLNNQTYISNNVNNSLTYFYGSPIRNYSTQRYVNINPEQKQPINQRSSYLSNYGNISLSVSQNQIYQKQNNKHDIISLRQKQYEGNINQYPRLSVEDKDNHYLQKIKEQKNNYQQNSINKQLNSSNQGLNKNNVHQIAGKHTFTVNPKKMQPQEYNYYPTYKKYFTPKMLNHVDQVSGIM